MGDSRFIRTGSGIPGRRIVMALLSAGLASQASAGGYVELSAGASLLGQGPGDQSGWTLAGAGDVDGDGLHDLLITVPNADVPGPDAGCVHLVMGRDSGWAPDLLLGDVSLASFCGEAALDQAGWSVAGVGDADGDGRADLLIGAPFNNEAGGVAGQSYLISGAGIAAGLEQPLDEAAIGSFLGEAADDWAGYAVAAAGDANGDGLDDLWLGAPHSSAGGSSAGAVYLVLGRAAACVFG